MMCKRLALMLTILFLACTDSPSEPRETDVSGTWRGNLEGATLTVVLAHRTADESISGTGTIASGETSIALSITGNFVEPTVAITITAAGYEAMNMTGQHSGSSIIGTVNGSGYSNSAVTLMKQ